MSTARFSSVPACCRHQRGFTLVEMVIVIIITGIVGAVVAVFLRTPVQGYVDTVSRAELADEADTAVRRMSRDLRLALPNSIRMTSAGDTAFLELLLTRTGGRYLDEADGVAGDILDFSDANDLSFRVVGELSKIPSQKIRAGDQIVIYNLGQAPADAYCTGSSCNNRATVAADVNPDTPTPTITLSANPFALQTPVIMRSPSHRFQVVSTPVTYACNMTTGRLTRYSGYDIQVDQPGMEPLAGVRGVLASGITGCEFQYTTLENMRSGLVGITFTLQRAGSGSITLFHQLHVDNTP